MFLSELSVPQKQAFLSIARAMTEVDGVKAEEEHLMAFFQLETGLAASDALVDNPIQFAAVFDDRRSQVSLLLELIGLGHTDAEYSDTERAFVQAFADAFDIPTEEIDLFENWVLRQIALFNEAQDFRTMQ